MYLNVALSTDDSRPALTSKVVSFGQSLSSISWLGLATHFDSDMSFENQIDLTIGSTLHQRQPSPLPQQLEICLDSSPTPVHRPPNHIITPPNIPRGSRFPSSPVSTPLPYSKIFPLLIARCSEGLNYAVIFPYINEMVKGFGVPEKSVGVWSASAVGPFSKLELELRWI